MSEHRLIDNACDGVWLDRRIDGYKKEIYLSFKKPLRDIESKIPFRYIGRISTSDYCFEPLAGTYAGDPRVLSEAYLDTLENYSITKTEPIKLYLRERYDGIKYISREDTISTDFDKCINVVEVNYDGKDNWSITAVPKN